MFGCSRESPRIVLIFQETKAAKFYKLLEDLKDCGEERSRGGLGISEKDWMKQKGFQYAQHESHTTMDMYGNSRNFLDGGQYVEMQSHIRVGHLRVYLCWSDEECRWLIGYFGNHLKTYTA